MGLYGVYARFKKKVFVRQAICQLVVDVSCSQAQEILRSRRLHRYSSSDEFFLRNYVTTQTILFQQLGQIFPSVWHRLSAFYLLSGCHLPFAEPLSSFLVFVALQ